MCGRYRRRLSICGRRHEQAVDRLEAPAAPHELSSEVVEKLRVRWASTESTEVAERFHKAASEVIAPDTVRDHSGCEWVLGLNEPTCEGKPTPGLG